ncbi:hypothetical protein QYE76_004920 [Lolium multiflorum]|uniref:Transcription initiation factor IIA subunit 2 n=1 Tax=Lolium multiflorum TaxID=4521 RepID=A0AAD8RS07_LOLMU|nr:hypothetical protein QYE76_004920 [Lolium multiflorum]
MKVSGETLAASGSPPGDFEASVSPPPKTAPPAPSSLAAPEGGLPGGRRWLGCSSIPRSPFLPPKNLQSATLSFVFSAGRGCGPPPDFALLPLHAWLALLGPNARRRRLHALPPEALSAEVPAPAGILSIGSSCARRATAPLPAISSPGPPAPTACGSALTLLKGPREGGMAALELYRMTTLGVNLTATLDEMVFSGRLSPELAVLVQLQFDESMSALLEKQVTSMAFFKGHLHTYRYCDNVWTFILRDVTFRKEEMAGWQNIGNVKIVACNSSLMKPKEPPQQQ